jgi:hypothetical protein
MFQFKLGYQEDGIHRYVYGKKRRNSVPPSRMLAAHLAARVGLVLHFAAILLLLLQKPKNYSFRMFIGEKSSVVDPDPGSGGFLTPGSGIRNRFFRIPNPYF